MIINHVINERNFLVILQLQAAKLKAEHEQKLQQQQQQRQQQLQQVQQLRLQQQRLLQANIGITNRQTSKKPQDSQLH